MNIEKITRRKARLDIYIFMFFVIWIFLRILDYMNVGGMEFGLYFTRMIVSFAAIFLALQYWYFSQKLTDELEQLIKYKAHKFSWLMLLISAMLIYVLNDKAVLSTQFSIELIIWIGYLSYFAALKFMEFELDSIFSEKVRNIAGWSAFFLIALIFGFNMGYTIPDLDYDVIEANSLLYYLVSGLIVAGSAFILLRVKKQLTKEER